MGSRNNVIAKKKKGKKLTAHKIENFFFNFVLT